MSASRLDSQVALVTGGGRGLGRVLAEALATEGMAVAVTGRDAANLNAAARAIRSLGARALAVPADVTDPEAVDRLFKRVTEGLGPVDVLVNNAGVTEHGQVWETDREEWWKVVEVNLRGPFLCSRAVLGDMTRRRRGRIVNVSSGVGNRASADQSAYAVSKAALTRLTDSLAAQAGPYGVTVFAISPGPLKTDMGLALSKRRGDIRDEDWVSPSLSGRLLVRICSGELDGLTGRFLSAIQDIDLLVARAAQIMQRDLLQLRLREA